MKTAELTENQKQAGFKMNNGMLEKFEIHTGQKNLRYTLWRYLFIPELGIRESYQGILGKSIDSVKKSLIARGLDDRFDMDNIEDEICIKVDDTIEQSEVEVAFISDGFVMKRKKAKSGNWYWINTKMLSKDFWDMWKKRKNELKEEGFFVTKNNITGEFSLMKMGIEL